MIDAYDFALKHLKSNSLYNIEKKDIFFNFTS